jgi:predicted nucleotidyltransferase
MEGTCLPVVGVITEYNPFHNGHLYHLHQAQKLTSAQATVCVMSGNFVQRGEPAIIDKWARTEMALRGGADLVFELPFCFAARSAYNFARGAIQLLERTGVITHICFGADTDDINLLQDIADILSLEPPEFRSSLKGFLSEGNSYPVARARAITRYLGEQGSGISLESLLHTLRGSNNILAIEYLRVLREENSSMVPVLIPRYGSSYHDSHPGTYASASAIRLRLHEQDWPQKVSPSLPTFSLEILKREFTRGRGPIGTEAMETALLAILRRTSTAHLAEIQDITEGLENRIKRAASMSNNLYELISNIKTKRYSLTRINRILLYVLLNVTKSQIRTFDQAGPTYLHLLGFSPSGQEILLKMKSICRIFLIHRVKDMFKQPPHAGYITARKMLELDIMATDLYSLLMAPPHRRGGKDYTTSPLFFSDTDA